MSSRNSYEDRRAKTKAFLRSGGENSWHIPPSELVGLNVEVTDVAKVDDFGKTCK